MNGPHQAASLARRLWVYQGERFPLARHAPLIAAFAAAGVSLSAHLGGRSLAPFGAFAVAFAVALLLFFQLRAADEVKDAEIDRRYRPERPIPRGLVGLGVIVGLGVAAVPIQGALVGVFDAALLLPLAAVWVWMGLMAVEFFVPYILKARPALYLVSHMLIMPLIDLFVTACEWLPAAGAMPRGLWGFLVLSFANGCVIEIGRKTWAPESERPGVESYSSAWGLGAAVRVWCVCLVCALVLVLAVGATAGAPAPVAAVMVPLAVGGLAVAAGFLRRPTRQGARRIEAVAGLWVFASYVTVGLFPPIFAGVAP